MKKHVYAAEIHNEESRYILLNLIMSKHVYTAGYHNEQCFTLILTYNVNVYLLQQQDCKSMLDKEHKLYKYVLYATSVACDSKKKVGLIMF
jgi:hypothetical protein